MTAPTVRAACLQLSPGNDVERNLAEIRRLLRAAVAEGAELVTLPEFGTFLDRSSAAMRAAAIRREDEGPLPILCQEAVDNKIWLLVGSVVMRPEQDEGAKLSNRSFLISPDGAICGRYDKIHLFDARLSDGRTVGESRHYDSGAAAVLVRTPFGAVGMTICYDVRFPLLYRQLALAGAEILMIPAAFAAETGKAHWDTLIRARAIENGCFVLAPTTCGVHPGDWMTHGHAAIVDPWGEIIAQCDGSSPGFAIADLEMDRVAKVRGQIPSLTTNPPYTIAEYSRAG
jgi:deaminated glutathione amidase